MKSRFNVRRGAMIAGLSGMLLLGGCAAANNHAAADSGRAAEHWTDFGAGQLKGVDQNAASAVFIRDVGVQGPAANIFVNGQYLTSLLPGAYKQSAVCAGNNRLTAHYTNANSHYGEKSREGTQFDIPAGQIAYFRVVPAAQGLGLERIGADAARQLIGKEQTHTVSRVTRSGNCTPVAAIKSYNLSASALFAFDRGDQAGLLPQGQRELRTLANDIAAQKVAIDRIEVIGHTDPEGSADYNMKLSQQRAHTVAQALAGNGLPSGLFRPQGKGEQQLVVADCRAKHPRNQAARKACDQPNRRVEVVVYGRKQAN